MRAITVVVVVLASVGVVLTAVVLRSGAQAPVKSQPAQAVAQAPPSPPPVAAPSRTAPPSAPQPTITILCGGSFRPPMERLANAYEAETGNKVELSFGQSEELLPQVKIGREGDLFVSHDPFPDEVRAADALGRSVQVGFVAPVLVVRKGNPEGLESLDDLAREGVSVALPDPEFSTCGKMLKALLERRGAWAKVLENANGAVFRSHSETANALKLGTREAGVMWNGTAHEFLDELQIVPTPYEYDETIGVFVMGLSYSDTPEAVDAFLDFCESKATDVFTEFGYVK